MRQRIRSPHRDPGFRVFRDSSNQWRWRGPIDCGADTIVVSHKRFTSRADCIADALFTVRE